MSADDRLGACIVAPSVLRCPGMPARPRILVAEDDPDVLRLLEQLMGALGEVVTAVDGLDVLAKVRMGPPPDVVVMDIMMPNMDGLTVAKELKNDPELAHVPVVMLTARTGPRDIVAGINAGARFYVTKPFKTDELVAKVQKALGHRR
jgi:two-component system, OmpR family, alkaline phosphatase synthesis response regulator PhoP